MSAKITDAAKKNQKQADERSSALDKVLGRLEKEKDAFGFFAENHPEIYDKTMSILNYIVTNVKKVKNSEKNPNLSIEQILGRHESQLSINNIETEIPKLVNNGVGIQSRVEVIQGSGPHSSDKDGIKILHTDLEKLSKNFDSNKKQYEKISKEIENIKKIHEMTNFKFGKVEEFINKQAPEYISANKNYQAGQTETFSCVMDKLDKLDKSIADSDVILSNITTKLDRKIDIRESVQILGLRRDVETSVEADIIIRISKQVMPAIESMKEASMNQFKDSIQDLENRCLTAGLIPMEKLFL